jgi:chromosome segregation ATPase
MSPKSNPSTKQKKPGKRSHHLTYDEVSAAMEYFKEQGDDRPGLLKLQKHLGGGSIPLIRKYREQFYAQTGQPDPIINALKAAATEVWAALSAEAETMTSSLEEELNASQDALEAAETARATLEKDHHAVSADLVAEKQRNESLEAELQKALSAIESKDLIIDGHKEMLQETREKSRLLVDSETKAREALEDKIKAQNDLHKDEIRRLEVLHHKEHETWQAKFDALEKEKQGIDKRRSNAETYASSINQKYEALQKDHDILVKKSHEQEIHHRQMDGELEALKRKLQEMEPLQKVVEDRTVEAIKLTERLEVAGERIIELSSELTQLREKYQSLLRECNNCKH